MKKYIPALLVLVLGLAGILYIKSIYGLPMSIEKQKQYVNSLLNKGLYRQASEVYEKLVDAPGLTAKQRANLAYLAGNIYMENSRDYESALADYLKVKVLAPDSELDNEVNQRSVECLERLGRSLDAQQEMEQYTSLDKGKAEPPKGSTVVAKIGNRSITMDELQRKIKELPPYYQELFKTREKQLDFLQQYIATELSYEKAKRKGYENDKDIVAQAFEAKKALMMQKLVKEEVEDNINITDKEMELYYEAHKKDFIEKKDKQEKQKTFDEARDNIINLLKGEKEKELYKSLILKLFQTENVKIYDDLFKAPKK